MQEYINSIKYAICTIAHNYQIYKSSQIKYFSQFEYMYLKVAAVKSFLYPGSLKMWEPFEKKIPSCISSRFKK